MQHFKNHIESFDNKVAKVTSEAITVPFRRSKVEAWSLFRSSVIQNQMGSSFVWIRYAAVLLIGFCTVAFYFSGSKSYQTGNSENLSITLPDNSLVDLQASSSLKFNRWSYLISRNLELTGDAVFSVEKGASFSVNGEFGKVSVFGTVFEVNSSDQLEVICHTGRVQVTTQNADKVLTGGQRFYSNKVYDKDEDALSFQKASAKLILNFIKEFYQVEISYSSELNQKYTGSIPLTNVNQAMRAICLPMGLQYKQEQPGKYRLIND